MEAGVFALLGVALKSVLDWFTGVTSQRAANTERRFKELSRLVDQIHGIDVELEAARTTCVAGEGATFGPTLEQLEWGSLVWAPEAKSAVDAYTMAARQYRLFLIRMSVGVLEKRGNAAQLQEAMPKYRAQLPEQYRPYLDARSALMELLATAARQQLPAPWTLPKWLSRTKQRS